MELTATVMKLTGDPKQDVKKLANHVFQMEEQLRYMLRNLDVTNFNDLGLARYENGRLQFYTEILEIQTNKLKVEFGEETEEIYGKIEATADGLRTEFADADEGLKSTITQTASELRTEFKKADEGLKSTITQTASALRTEFADADEGLKSTITQTASELRTEFKKADEGLKSTITQTASALRTEFADADAGLKSQIKQNADKIAAIVEGENGDYAALSITVDEIKAEVEGARGSYASLALRAGAIQSIATGALNTANSFSSRITQTENQISAVVTSTGAVNAAAIVAAINDSGSEVYIQADKVGIGGLVTFSDLENNYSSTVINGANIRTGEIELVSLAARGDMYSNIDSMTGLLIKNYPGRIIGRAGYGNAANSGVETYWENQDQFYLATYEYQAGTVWMKPTIKIKGAGGVSIETDLNSPIYISAGSYITLDAAEKVIIRDNLGAEWEFVDGGLYKNGTKVL